MSKTLSTLTLAIAGLLLALATAIGAIASHILEGVLSADALATFSTGVDYQFYHSLGLLALGIYGQQRFAPRFVTISATLLLLGILLFCGGVYASSLDGPRWIARLAPTGGVSLIAGWLVFAVGMLWSLAARPDRSA